MEARVTKVRFPLYAKLLLWFFLNLLVLAVAISVFLVAQFRLGSEMLVSTAAGERLLNIAAGVRDEMNGRTSEEWDKILDEFGVEYHRQFVLFRNDGEQIAGAKLAIPKEVEERLVEPRRMRGEGPPDRPLDLHPGEMFDPLVPPPHRRMLMKHDAMGPRVRFVVRAGEPRAYWIGIPMPRGEPGNGFIGGPATLILVSKSLNAGGLILRWQIWVWPLVAALLFSALFWLPLVRGITRSISQMQAATARIAEGKFDVRVSDGRRDELGALGNQINRMASRLDGFVTGQKRFLGDIAHELCSPIARMQMALGILEERSDQKAASYVWDVKEEVEHMSALVNELLSFSRASLGSSSIRLQQVELHAVVEKAMRREGGEGASLRNEVPLGLQVLADPELVMRAVSNLLRNAIRYAGGAGPIVISARETDEVIELSVADSGPGVPEGEIPKLFDPFYRVDVSRTRETGGAGLGLAIVKTCIESCAGTVACRNRQPTGLEALIRLPKVGGHDRGRTCTDFSTGS